MINYGKFMLSIKIINVWSMLDGRFYDKNGSSLNLIAQEESNRTKKYSLPIRTGGSY